MDTRTQSVIAAPLDERRRPLVSAAPVTDRRYNSRFPYSVSRSAVWTAIALALAFGSLKAGDRPKPSAAPGPNRSVMAARRSLLRSRPLKMLYYHDDARGLESLRAHASEMSMVAPQCFSVDAEGFVRGAVPGEVAAIARDARLPVMPLVVNRGFDRDTVSAMLRSLRAQQRAATYLAYLARRDNYTGFQIDVENIDPRDRYRLTRFVQRVAWKLHSDGRLVSVAVVPRFSDSFPGGSASGEFVTGQWGAPYDYRALGRIVDFLTVMTYDHHGRNGPPGPIAGQAWVAAALEYAARRIPPWKILLGIPFYGRDWCEAQQGTTARGLTFTDATALLSQPDVQPQWDDRWRAPWFQYRDTAGLHTVWFEDSRSLGEKLDLIRKYHLRGFAAWRLGAEDPEFWSLSAVSAKKASPSPDRPAHASVTLSEAKRLLGK